MTFRLPPDGIGVNDPSDILSLVVFVGSGVAIAGLNHQLRVAKDTARDSAATATVRAERLDAVLNTTIDGIIVISANGLIEAFNRGAEQLFGYPEAEVRGERQHPDAVAASRRT